jgi:DNA (cytosine-5)-methyltransferase 1
MIHSMKRAAALDVEYRFNLRLPPDVCETMDRLRCDSIDKLSRNAWVLQAVREKIATYDTSPQSAEDRVSGRPFYEFFAGGGMARAGLGQGWNCVFANDFDPMKGRVYRENWGGNELKIDDVRNVTLADLPGIADLAWASFPCQDLSLAGKYRGIGLADAQSHTRSGTFWPFWGLICNLACSGRAPRMIVLENVYGILTSHQGRDFAAIAAAIHEVGYRFGALVVDARLFVPQSRPRVFIIAFQRDMRLPTELIADSPGVEWHPLALRRAFQGMPDSAKDQWIWWNMRLPPEPIHRLADLVEDAPDGVNWHSRTETETILAMMSPINRKKLNQAMRAGRRMVGGVYRRTREDDAGNKVQRAEVRFDDCAGCLRTPAGGSSRQMIIVVDGKKVRTRLLSPREAARLMGLPDSYELPHNYNDAYHVAGDGVVVPVVRHLANEIIEPLLRANGSNNRAGIVA